MCVSVRASQGCKDCIPFFAAAAVPYARCGCRACTGFDAAAPSVTRSWLGQAGDHREGCALLVGTRKCCAGPGRQPDTCHRAAVIAQQKARGAGGGEPVGPDSPVRRASCWPTPPWPSPRHHLTPHPWIPNSQKKPGGGCAVIYCPGPGPSSTLHHRPHFVSSTQQWTTLPSLWRYPHLCSPTA